MAQVGRPAGRKYSETFSFVVTADVAEAIKARAERERHTVSGWLRVAVEKALEAEPAVMKQ